MTLTIFSATPVGGRRLRRRAMANGIAATALAFGVLIGSATSAAADPTPGHLAGPPAPGHKVDPDCWLCIM